MGVCATHSRQRALGIVPGNAIPGNGCFMIVEGGWGIEKFNAV